MITGIRRSVVTWTLAGKDVPIAEWQRKPCTTYYNLASCHGRQVKVVAAKPIHIECDGEVIVTSHSGYFIAIATVPPGGRYRVAGISDADVDSWQEEHHAVDQVGWPL